MARSDQTGSELHAIVAGLLAWLVPGVGHFYLRQYWRGAVFLAVITVTFWSGVAIGGVVSTVSPRSHPAWFVAELCTAGNALGGLALRSSLPEVRSANPSPYLATWPADDIGLVYCGVAGLLNVLVILDAMARGGPESQRHVPARSGPKGKEPR
jgi:hypothetical protein